MRAGGAVHSTTLTVDRALEIFVTDGALDAAHTLLSIPVGRCEWVWCQAKTFQLTPSLTRLPASHPTLFCAHHDIIRTRLDQWWMNGSGRTRMQSDLSHPLASKEDQESAVSWPH